MFAAWMVGYDPGPTLAERLAAWRPAWMARAACRGMAADVFFPPRGHDSREAKTTCATCSVRSECLRWARSTGEPAGIWGGLAVGAVCTPPPPAKSVAPRRKPKPPEAKKLKVPKRVPK